MSSKDDPIIEIRDLTKTFVIGQSFYGLKNFLLHMPLHLWNIKHQKICVALNHINLTVKRGERVGVTGRNGCGKTTLLSVIGKVYKSYTGFVAVRGAVSMMLALSAGFSPTLSGRDNIMLNGVLQGKTRKEMQAVMEDIIEFADIGDFIDAPIYQYSSGMQARLGFGIITAIEPEILLVDEVMAVGDADFAQKCEKRINRLLDRGTTLFLVSHSMSNIRKYCNREVRLDHGNIVYDGPVS